MLINSLDICSSLSLEKTEFTARDTKPRCSHSTRDKSLEMRVLDNMKKGNILRKQMERKHSAPLHSKNSGGLFQRGGDQPQIKQCKIDHILGIG
jgi:hypothetical protein